MNLAGMPCQPVGKWIEGQRAATRGKIRRMVTPLDARARRELADEIKRASDDLIRQMKELASEIAEAKARREDRRKKPPT
jgi:F0F1-type ATP synthase membrane subunit b/b'